MTTLLLRVRTPLTRFAPRWRALAARMRALSLSQGEFAALECLSLMYPSLSGVRFALASLNINPLLSGCGAILLPC